MSELLGAVGVRSSATGAEPRTLRLTAAPTVEPVAPYELVERMRASTAVLGPLLARCGRGPALAAGRRRLRRPADRHAPGAAWRRSARRSPFDDDYLEAVADDGLRGADIALEFPSVGATENIIMAAVLAKGTTMLDNAAREPEIVDLCRFLVGMGAQIEGIGSPVVIVHGVPAGDLARHDHRVVADRVEAATYLAAVGLAGGEITVRDARAEHMEVMLRKLRARWA